MKKILIFVVFLVVRVHAQTPTLIDWAAWPNSDGSTSAFSATPDYLAPLAEPTQGGETIITPLCYDNTGANQSITVTDQQGDTPTLVTTTGTNTDNSKRCDIYLFSNVVAGNNWTKAHLTSGSSTLTTWQMWNVKVYNVTASSPVDKAVCAASTGATAVSVVLPTLSNSGDFVFQFSYASNWVAPNQSGKITVGSGFTPMWDQVGDGSAAQYQVYNSTTGFTSTFTQPTAAHYISCVVALKAGASGGASTLYPRVAAVEADAKPKTMGVTWNAAFTSTTGNVYLTTLCNDPPATSSPVVSSPTPSTAWTASGIDGTSSNGHNHDDIYSSHFSTIPGLFSLTITNQGGSNDAIYMLYDVVGGTTTLDGDTGQSAGILTLNGTQVTISPGTSGSFTWCSACLTPTQVNDIVIGVYGEAWGTITGMIAPSAAINDSCYWLGTSIDGPSQACENNGFFHYVDTGTGAITATWTITAGTNAAPNWWGGRLAAYKSSTQPAQACPSGTPVSGGTCYYVGANGSDSNSGTSETSPWLHAPGMPNCTANCAAVTPGPGKGIILRGGDTWHFGNTGLSPYSGGTWSLSLWNGTDASCIFEGTTAGCIYWGVDTTWFSGTSWTRPVMNGDNALSTSPVASCTYQVAPSTNNILIQAGVADIIDNFEITGFCSSRNPASGGPSTDIMIGYGGTGISGSGMLFLDNLYIHGWTATTTAGQTNNTVACTILGGGGNGLQTIDHDVIDGVDSDPKACAWGTFPSFYHMRDSIVRYMTQGVGQWCHDIHDNIFEHSFAPHWPTHANLLECNNDGQGNAVNQPANTPNVFYNNIFRHDDPGMTANPDLWVCPPANVAEYYFNNILYDLIGQFWSIAGPAGYGANCSNAGGQFMFNNTMVDGTQPCHLNALNNGTNGAFLTVLNQHLIGTGYDGTGCTGGASSGTNVSISDAVGTSQSYTTGIGGTAGTGNNCANDTTTPCSPISITKGSVGTGANHQAYCTALAGFTSEQAISTDAANACKNGTTDGCTYNTSIHAMICPAQTAVTRPISAAWDVGAYQFPSNSSTPSIYAFHAPVISSMPNYTAYQTLLTNSLLQGQALLVGGGTNSNTELLIDTETTANVVCTPTFNWTVLDAAIASKLSSIILGPAKEGGLNTFTPQCVWSQAQADASNLPYTQNTFYLPGEYIFQNSTYWQLQTGCGPTVYDNTCQDGATAATFSPTTVGTNITDGSVHWISTGLHAPLQNGFCSTSYICGTAVTNCFLANSSVSIVINNGSLGPCTQTELYQSQPIPSELPLRNWFNQIITATITHYNGNANVKYLRIGSPAGGELSPNGVLSFLWPNYGSTHNMARAEFLSWVKKFYTFIVAQSPTMMLDGDMNCEANDCLFADQEAQLAHDFNFQILNTNGWQIWDTLNLQGTGPTPCALPLVAGSSCTSGDWSWNFFTFNTNAAGQKMYHLLQPIDPSTPIYCASLVQIVGPLASLPPGLSTCPAGYVGMLPFLVTLRNAGIGAGQIINVDYLELAVTGQCGGSLPTQGNSDILLALYPSYSSTTCTQAAYTPYASAYKAAFQIYEAVPPLPPHMLGITGVGN